MNFLHPNYGWNCLQMDKKSPSHAWAPLFGCWWQRKGWKFGATNTIATSSSSSLLLSILVVAKERGRMKERKEFFNKKNQNEKMMAPWIKTGPFFKVVFLVFFSHLVFVPKGFFWQLFLFFFPRFEYPSPTRVQFPME